jgi:hypothetical protein
VDGLRKSGQAQWMREAMDTPLRALCHSIDITAIEESRRSGGARMEVKQSAEAFGLKQRQNKSCEVSRMNYFTIRGVAVVFFQMVEKTADEWSIQVLNGQHRG